MVNRVGRVGGTDADGAAHGEVDVASFGRVIGHVQSEVIGPPFRARPRQLAGLVDPGRGELVGATSPSQPDIGDFDGSRTNETVEAGRAPAESAPSSA